MAVFTNLNSTLATLDPGFDYSAFSAQIEAAMASLDAAGTMISTTDPVVLDVDANSVDALWADGTELEADVTAIGAASVTIDEIKLKTPDDAELEVEGSARITQAPSGEILLSNFSVKELEFGNELAKQDIAGSMTLNFDTGALSGTVKSVKFEWLADDILTPGIEWRYIELKGSVQITGDIWGALALNGNFTSFEWGTEIETGEDSFTQDEDGNIANVRIGAATLSDELDDHGFDALMAGIFSGNDVIDGTSGNDFLESSSGNDKVQGEDGADHIDGGSGNDQLFGGSGDDHIVGGSGNDRIVDDSGHNEIEDTEGNANVTTGSGDDTVTTGGGNDRIVAGAGHNTITTGAGNDNITCGGGNDDIDTAAGNDRILAGNGDNTIDAGSGNDNINTGNGDDWINGGDGRDVILGGAGPDVFVFDNLGTADLVKDFSAADDRIALDTSIFTALAGGFSADNLVLGKAAADANDYLVFNSQGGKLYYDADGNGSAAAVQIAILKGAVNGLSIANFADMDSLLV